MSAGELADKLKVDIEEIQIWSGAMERAGGSASGLQSTIEKLNASGKAQGDAIGVLLDLADKADYHTYGVEWTPDHVSFLMDGRKTLTVNADPNNPNWPFNKENNPYYLLLDMQLGGDWVGDIGDIGDGVAMTVDYVRVYSAAPVPEPATASLSLLALSALLMRRRRP